MWLVFLSDLSVFFASPVCHLTKHSSYVYLLFHKYHLRCYFFISKNAQLLCLTRDSFSAQACFAVLCVRSMGRFFSHMFTDFFNFGFSIFISSSVWMTIVDNCWLDNCQLSIVNCLTPHQYQAIRVLHLYRNFKSSQSERGLYIWARNDCPSCVWRASGWHQIYGHQRMIHGIFYNVGAQFRTFPPRFYPRKDFI